METLKAQVLVMWDVCQILAYVGLAVGMIFGVPAIIVFGLVGAGWAHP